MPTTYAHYVFGQECFSVLDDTIKKIIVRNRYIYDIGVHGPDIFFYYKALEKNEVNQYGSDIHHVPARGLFENAKQVYHQFSDSQEAMLAYLLGLLSHYALDSSVHGYVERKKDVSGVSHNKIEAEYDGHLMRQNGLIPQKVNRASSLHPSRFIAEIISRFYPYDENLVLEAIEGQVKCLELLNSPRGIKKGMFFWVTDKFHLQTGFGDLFVENEELEACKDSNLRLDKLKVAALEKYKRISDNFLAYLKDEEELCEYFDSNFEYMEENYLKIPVFSVEEELKYSIKGEEYGEIEK